MMKLLVVSTLVAFAAAIDVSHLLFKKPTYHPIHHSAPVGSEYNAQIVKSAFELDPNGAYQYGYETENGIAAQQQGQQKQIGAELGNVAQGSFSFTSPEGVPVALQYVADENGYQPHSDSIPTPPPVPEPILRSLQYNAAHPEPNQPVVQYSPFVRKF